MISTKYKFVFLPYESARLMDDIGRDDVSALAFINDVEACLQAFDYAASGNATSGLPDDVAADLSAIVTAAAKLRSMLYRLPEDMGLLIDLHLLAEGARRRVAADLSQLVEPLEDIAGAISEIRNTARDQENTKSRLENRLVRALAMAYRNRLNRKPTWHADSGFPALLAAIFAFAGDRLPSIASMRSEATSNNLRDLVRDSLEAGRQIAA